LVEYCETWKTKAGLKKIEKGVAEDSSIVDFKTNSLRAINQSAGTSMDDGRL
jgi:hypothetical protein